MVDRPPDRGHIPLKVEFFYALPSGLYLFCPFFPSFKGIMSIGMGRMG